MKGEESVIFLPPNTAVNFPQASELIEFDFSYAIHPWVKENSDGAVIYNNKVGLQ